MKFELSKRQQNSFSYSGLILVLIIFAIELMGIGYGFNFSDDVFRNFIYVGFAISFILGCVPLFSKEKLDCNMDVNK